MKVIINGRKFEIEQRLKELIEKKLGKLDKFFRDDADAKVTITGEKAGKSVMEVTVFSGGMIYRAEERTDDVFSAIDKTVTVIERQIRKNKTRLEKRLRAGAFESGEFEIEPVEEEKEFNIVKTKHISIKPMSPEEAILQMNLLGHNFFVFRNDKTEQANVVYVRNDNDYGLIELD